MKRTIVVMWIVLLAGAALVLSAGACGSGGGGPDLTIVQLSGVYFFHFLACDVGPGPMGVSRWLTLTGDGVNMVTGGSTMVNAGGTIAGPIPLTPFPYTAGPNGAMSFGGGYMGGIAADGSVVTLCSTTSGQLPEIAIGLRRQGTFSTVSLTGDYHMAAFFTNGVLMQDTTWFGGTASFDGAGNIMAATNLNNSGVITPAPAPMAFGTYSVAADGTVTWTGPMGFETAGGMLEGGELVVLAGLTTATDLQILIVLIKKGAGLSNATFNGTYHTVGMIASPMPPPSYGANVTRTFANGAGEFRGAASSINNNDGSISSNPPDAPLPYLVAGDGTLTVVGFPVVGAVSSSGRFAVVAGFDAPGASPFFAFLAR